MFYLENIFILLSTVWKIYRNNAFEIFILETNLNLNVCNEVLFIYFSYLIFGKKLILVITYQEMKKKQYVDETENWNIRNPFINCNNVESQMIFPTYGTAYVLTKPLINAAEIESMSASKRAQIGFIVVISEAYSACMVFSVVGGLLVLSRSMMIRSTSSLAVAFWLQSVMVR